MGLFASCASEPKREKETKRVVEEEGQEPVSSLPWNTPQQWEKSAPIGGGVGYYEPATKKFVGHHEHLNFLTPRGMVVMDDLQEVVYSGRLQDDPAFPRQTPAEAQLVVYDMELKEVKRLTLKPGLKSTGQLFLCPPASASKKSTQIVGVVPEDKVMYRYDLANETLLQWVQTPSEFGRTIQKTDDGSLWSVMDGALVRIDPFTLKWKTLGKFQSPIKHMTWLGNQLYVTTGGGSRYMAGAELDRVEKGFLNSRANVMTRAELDHD